MIFFPYRVDMELRRLPLVTLAVCIICVYVFLQQLHSYAQYQNAITTFCNQQLDKKTRVILRQLTEQQGNPPCADIFLAIRESDNPEIAIQTLVSQAAPLNLFKSREEELEYMLKGLRDAYHRFERNVPANLTDELQFNPTELKIKRMVTAVFSHGGWAHLIFNLVFFYAFAASVEVIVGSLVFSLIIVTMAVTTGLAYSLSVAGTPETAVPTIGLSGVVMGMMALLAVLAPKIKIRCFFWFLLLVRFFRLPALLLASWYVGWDIYHLMTQQSANINFVAHVSGAGSGIIIGMLYWYLRTDYVRHINAQT